MNDIAQALMLEKVAGRVLHRLTAAGSPLPAQLLKHPRFATVQGRREVLLRTSDAVLATVHELASNLGLPVWALKGLSARRMYSDPQLRDLGDLDLMVATFDDAVRLTGALRELGYGFNRHELPWIKRTSGPRDLYGQFSLHHRDPAHSPGIDLHFGGYSIRHCALHPLPELDKTPGLSYLTPAQNLPMMVGNAAGDHKITTKDLNDLALALDQPDVNVRRLLTQL
ncbi:nucleotidyltransferase family protein, partial [Nonomuraea sp. NPDC004297]